VRAPTTSERRAMSDPRDVASRLIDAVNAHDLGVLRGL
jgi:hypothetical protein